MERCYSYLSKREGEKTLGNNNENVTDLVKRSFTRVEATLFLREGRSGSDDSSLNRKLANERHEIVFRFE